MAGEPVEMRRTVSQVTMCRRSRHPGASARGTLMLHHPPRRLRIDATDVDRFAAITDEAHGSVARRGVFRLGRLQPVAEAAMADKAPVRVRPGRQQDRAGRADQMLRLAAGQGARVRSCLGNAGRTREQNGSQEGDGCSSLHDVSPF